MADRLATGPSVIRPNSRPLGPGEPRVLVADTTRLRNDAGYTPPDDLAGDIAAYYRCSFDPKSSYDPKST